MPVDLSGTARESGRMMDHLVANLLNQYLGKYIQNLESENLNVGIFRGKTSCGRSCCGSRVCGCGALRWCGVCGLGGVVFVGMLCGSVVFVTKS